MGRRLVLFPLPFQGHLNPMLQLANIMHARGFSITIIHTHFNSPNPSNYLHFTFHSIPDGLLKSQASSSDATALIGLLNINCVAPFQDCLSRLLLQTSEEPIACLVTDILWPFTQAVANSLKLPRIVLRTNSAASSLAFATLLSLHERGWLSVKEVSSLLCHNRCKCRAVPFWRPNGYASSQLESPVPEIPPLKVKDLPNINTRDEEVFYQQIASAFRLEESELSRLHQYFRVPIFTIGPFQNQQRAALLMGGLTRVGTWLGVARIIAKRVPRDDEWKGHIVKWASQQEVLTHPATGGFWTHCGWNSTLGSICFGDQRVNARYASEVWKVGEIERTIRRLMAEEEGQEMRRRVMHLKELVNLSLKPGGSSHRSLERFVAQLL
ncbi:hypothetical protein AAG906_022908 [Vitis piasezkii]